MVARRKRRLGIKEGLGIEKCFVEEKSFGCVPKSRKDFKKQRWEAGQAFWVERNA